MASYLLLPLLLFHLPLLAVSKVSTPATSSFDAIFSFGDSLSDTGNLIRTNIGNVGRSARAGHYPYGRTFFHHSTGRFSDGRLIPDFIAEAMGLPLLRPYLAGGDFRQGVNFAVGGATALNNDFFRERGINVTWTDYSLGIQIEWFRAILPTLCSSKKSGCKNLLGRSLLLVGEIGGNDYNHAFREGSTINKIQTFVPNVVNAISSAITVLVKLGAKTLVVPGNLPIGCISFYLTIFRSPRVEDYDPKTGCLKWLNEFSTHHNSLLRGELDRLRLLHPHATIIYADYYEAAMEIFQDKKEFGFKQVSLAACCGGGGPYNFNISTFCGEEGMRMCDDPSKYICWDGWHLTEAAYKIIAQGLLNGRHALPPIVSMPSHKELATNIPRISAGGSKV